MNKECIYIDGKVIVSDDDGNKKLVSYYDNIKEVLEQENLIEALNDKVLRLTKENADLEKYNKNHLARILVPLLGSIIGPIVAVSVLMAATIVGGDVVVTMQSWASATLFATTSSAVLGSFCSLAAYWSYKEDMQSINKNNYAIKYLEKNIVEQNKKLVEMKKQSKKGPVEKGFASATIDTKATVNSVNGYTDLYKDCADNMKKYYRYYQEHDRLPRKVLKKYDDASQEVIVDIVKENGPQLVKKRNYKRK